MLEFELLEKLVLYAEKKSQTLGKRNIYTIATNFTLVSQKRIDFLQKYNFNLHISINWNKKNNNTSRDGSSKIVFTNIEKYFTKTQRENICILFAFSPNNIQDIEENLEFLIAQGMSYFNLEMIFWKQYHWDNEGVREAVISFKKIKEKYPRIRFANIEDKWVYIDINTDWTSWDNSLAFHDTAIDMSAKLTFDALLSRLV